MAVTLHTTLGDLKLEIYCDTAPRTSFNFLALCASDYYAGTLFHRNMRKGMNGWISMITRIAGALAQLRASAVIFRNRGLKKALNTMNQQRLARQAAFGSMKRAAMSFINAALVRGYRKLQAGGRMRGKLKLASRQILYRNRRKGFNGWTSMMAEKARRKWGTIGRMMP